VNSNIELHKVVLYQEKHFIGWRFLTPGSFAACCKDGRLFCCAGLLSVEGRGKGTNTVATVLDMSELTLVGKGPRLFRTLLNHQLLQRQSQPKLHFKQPVRANWSCFSHNPTVCNARINSTQVVTQFSISKQYMLHLYTAYVEWGKTKGARRRSVPVFLSRWGPKVHTSVPNSPGDMCSYCGIRHLYCIYIFQSPTHCAS
jgi:hypothetical protein